MPDQAAIDALAEVWSEVMGQLDTFRYERQFFEAKTTPWNDSGVYRHRKAEAAESARLLRSRGFDIVRKE